MPNRLHDVLGLTTIFSSSSQQAQHAPSHGRLKQSDPRIRWALFALGAASLLNWNAMITATPYFAAKLDGSSLQTAIASYVSLVFNVLNLVVLVHATATAKNNVALSRIRPSILGLIICLFALTLSPILSMPPTLFFLLVIVNTAAQAVAGGYLICSVVSLASLLCPNFVQATASGHAAIGVLISVIELISASLAIGTKRTTTMSDKEDALRRASTSAFIFFGTSCALLILALWIHSWVIHQPDYLNAVKSHRRHAAPEDAADDGGTSDEEDPLVADQDDEVKRFMSVEIEDRPTGDKELGVWHVAKLNGSINSAITIAFTVTLALFPPITNMIQSVHAPPPPETLSISNPILFNALHFLIFNLGDYLGRAILAFPIFVIWSGRTLLLISISRIIFIPLFLACNIQLSPLSISGFVPSTAPISSDLIYMAILLLFGITNGHTATLCMMSAASTENNKRLRKEQVELAATIAQFFLSGGVAAGSLISFAVRGYICGCNPFRE